MCVAGDDVCCPGAKQRLSRDPLDVCLAVEERACVDLNWDTSFDQGQQRRWVSLDERVALGMRQQRAETSGSQAVDRTLDEMHRPIIEQVALQQQPVRVVQCQNPAVVKPVEEVSPDPRLVTRQDSDVDPCVTGSRIESIDATTNLFRACMMCVRSGDHGRDPVIRGGGQHCQRLVFVACAIVDAR